MVPADNPHFLGLRERFLLMGIATAVFCLYFPATHMADATSGHTVITSLDEAIPIQPWWVIVYAGALPSSYLPGFVVADRRVFHRLVWSYVLAILVATATFLAFPVAMTLRVMDLDPGNFPSWGLRFYYWADASAGCFPSLHVAMVTLAGLWCLRVDRAVGLGALFWAFLVGLSTLFVRQHYVADVVSGFALGTLSFLALNATLRLPDTPPAHLSLPRRWLAVPVAGFGLFVAAFWGLYVAGFNPWERWPTLPLPE